jgi:hypothetical protein
MKATSHRIRAIRLVPLLPAGLLAACCSAGPPYEVRMIPDEDSLKNPTTGIFETVSVDLIPVQKLDLTKWQKASVSNHFTPGTPENRARLDLFKNKMLLNYEFSQKSSATTSLPIDDPVWRKVEEKGLEYLVILADLPNPSPSESWDKAGPDDGRRLIIPIDSRHWDESTIKIQIFRNGLHLDTKCNPDT